MARALGRVPRGRWQTSSELATLTPTGIGESVVVPGPIDGAVFNTFVTEHLTPALRHGQIVDWDNLSVHKSPRARAAIAAVGCQVAFLPTSSPDLNPIALAFATTKQHLRRAQARSFEAVVAARGAALTTTPPTDAQAFYHAADYPGIAITFASCSKWCIR